MGGGECEERGRRTEEKGGERARETEREREWKIRGAATLLIRNIKIEELPECSLIIGIAPRNVKRAPESCSDFGKKPFARPVRIQASSAHTSAAAYVGSACMVHIHVLSGRLH